MILPPQQVRTFDGNMRKDGGGCLLRDIARRGTLLVEDSFLGGKVLLC